MTVTDYKRLNIVFGDQKNLFCPKKDFFSSIARDVFRKKKEIPTLRALHLNPPRIFVFPPGVKYWEVWLISWHCKLQTIQSNVVFVNPFSTNRQRTSSIQTIIFEVWTAPHPNDIWPKYPFHNSDIAKHHSSEWDHTQSEILTLCDIMPTKLKIGYHKLQLIECPQLQR